MKKLFTRTIGLLALLVVGNPVFAQNDKSITMARLWNADSTSNTYCHTLGKRGSNSVSEGSARGADFGPSPLKVKTVGLDDEVVSATASSGALKFLDVGDLFVVSVNGQRHEYLVIANPDDDSITLETDVDLSTAQYFFWRKRVCGTGEDAGAIPVGDLDNFILTIHVNAMTVDAGDINVFIECRHPYGDFLVVESAAINNGGDDTDNFLTRVFESESWDACRVGVNVEDDDDEAAAGVDEQINMYLSGKGVIQ